MKRVQILQPLYHVQSFEVVNSLTRIDTRAETALWGATELKPLPAQFRLLDINTQFTIEEPETTPKYHAVNRVFKGEEDNFLSLSIFCPRHQTYQDE